jgi:phosphoserine phosphatase
VDAADITAYADSSYDLPLFRSVGTAVAVRPDEHLAAVADAEGWEVLGAVRRRLLSWMVPRRPESPADLPDRG